MTLTRRSILQWAIGVATGTVLAKMPIAGAQQRAPERWPHSFFYGIDRDSLTKYKPIQYPELRSFIDHRPKPPVDAETMARLIDKLMDETEAYYA